MAISTTEQHYFALMRAALWGGPVQLEGWPDWEGIMHIAGHHSTEVLVADVASRMKEDCRPSDELLRQMKQLMMGNLVNQMELKQILIKSVKALREKGIDPVLLKGFSLAQLYPNPSLRQFGDIDLYVGQQQFHEACTVLRGLSGGYNWGEDIDVGRHYNIEFGRHPMEVHRVSSDVIDPKDQAIYATIEQDGLIAHPQSINFEGFDLSIPSKEFMVFFTFFHAWEHFLTTGVGWRQISDVAMVLNVYYGQLELPELRSWIESMRLMEPWQTFGWLMVERLGLPAEKLPFYDASCRSKAPKLYKRIMLEGNFRRQNRFKNRKPKGRLMKKIHSFIVIFVEFFQLVFLFPKQAWHETKTLLKTSFWKNFQKK